MLIITFIVVIFQHWNMLILGHLCNIHLHVLSLFVWGLFSEGYGGFGSSQSVRIRTSQGKEIFLKMGENIKEELQAVLSLWT